MSKIDIIDTITVIKKNMLQGTEKHILYDLYSDPHMIKELPPLADVATNMILASNGVVALLKGCIVYGSFVYNSLFTLLKDPSHERSDSAISAITRMDVSCGPIDSLAKFQNIQQMLQKYSSSVIDTDTQIEYKIGSVYVCVDKYYTSNDQINVHCWNILSKVTDYKHKICAYGGKILVHPICHVNLICKYNYDSNICITNNDDYDCIRHVVFDSDNLIQFINSSVHQHDVATKNHLIETTFKICLYLCKYDLIQKLIEQSIIPPKYLLYDAVTERKIEYIKILSKNNISFDIVENNNINSVGNNGKTPLEIASELYNTDKSYIDIIIELNKCRYMRNPKYWNICIGTHIYDESATSSNEQSFIEKLKTTKISTINELNDIILDNLLCGCSNSDAKHSVLRPNVVALDSGDAKGISQSDLLISKFIEHNINWFNHTKFMDNIVKYHNVNIFSKIYTLFIPKYINTILEYCVKLQQYDIILSIKNNIGNDETQYNKFIQILLQKVINLLDFKGLIFIAEYFGQSVLATEFPNRDTILHLLCRVPDTIIPVQSHTLVGVHVHQLPDVIADQNMIGTNNTFEMYKCFKVIQHYVPYLTNAKNNNNISPLYDACNNGTLLELLMINGAIVQPSILHTTETFIHHIVEFGSIKNLKKSLLYYGELINDKNINGETPVVLAGRLQKSDMCNLLILHGAKTNICDNDGNLLEHYICLNGLSNVNCTLTNSKNKFGYTAQDYMLVHLHKCIDDF